MSDDDDGAKLLQSPLALGDGLGQLDCGLGANIPVLYLPNEYRAIRLYRPTLWKQLVYGVASILSFGVLPLVSYYVPLLQAACTLTPLSSAYFATVVLVQHMESGMWETISVHHGDSIWFEFRKHRYVFDEAHGVFQRCSAAVHATPLASVRPRLQTGYSDDVAAKLNQYFGPNLLDISLEPLHKILLEKALHPFYLFQITSVFLWLYEAYYTYSCIILVMSVSSLLFEGISQVTNTRKLYDLVQKDQEVVAKVLRSHQVENIPAKNLVIGDIVVLETGSIPADMLLLEGECGVDESSLTGEAIPVNKHSAPPNATIDSTSVRNKYKASVVSAGSAVVRIDVPCKAIVLATGFHTSKGELFRSIVCPKPIQFQVERDSYRFLAALSILAVLTGLKNSYDAAIRGLGFIRIVVSWLDLITIAVPPALPLILSVGVGYAIQRLEVDGICCIDSPKVNLAGHLTCFCFDKTGTLTKDHMSFEGVDVVTANDTLSGLVSLDKSPRIVQYGAGMCHSVYQSQDGLVGSPLEKSMFEASGFSWLDDQGSQVQDPATGERFTYIKKFAFDPALQRSSVVLDKGQVFVKGSPEAMMECCLSVPKEIHQTVHEYAKAGYYCMGLATKTLDDINAIDKSNIARAQVESNLTFIGLLLFLNPIKEESPELISALQNASIDIRIITGDNALTGIHVARALAFDLKPEVVLIDMTVNEHGDEVVLHHIDTGVVEPYSADGFLRSSANADFALTGAALNRLQTSGALDVDLIEMVEATKIFARIRPDQKTWLVQTLMAQGKYVGMCGDGTNDCGALKAAHVGLALSDAEASIVAPFTSRKQNILDVLTLIREGRCALMTSYVGFKFMVMYPVAQVVMTSTLYSSLVTLSNNQFLLDDMVIVLGLSLSMLYTEPTKILTVQQPPTTLFARSILWSIGGHIIIYVLCFGLMLSIGTSESWFCSVDQAKANMTNCYTYIPPPGDGYTRVAHENAIVWLFGHWEFVLVAVAINLKDPFRQAAWPNNNYFVGYVAAMILLLLGLTLSHQPTLLEWFELAPIPTTFRLQILGIVLLNGVCTVAWEYIVTRHLDKAPAMHAMAEIRIT
ncbi:unnamed protein product [Aphanomyces euteiches]